MGDKHTNEGQDDDGGSVSEVSAMDGGAEEIFPSDATAGYPIGEDDPPTGPAGEGTRPEEGEAGPDAVPESFRKQESN